MERRPFGGQGVISDALPPVARGFALGRCYPPRMRCSVLAAGPPARIRVPDVSAAMLFHGPIVSTMILIPATALSIWRCTLSTSDFKKSCIFWSSETNLRSSYIEFEVNRATVALISGGPEGLEFSLLSWVAKA